MLGMWDWLPRLLCCYKDQSKDLAVSWVLAAPSRLKGKLITPHSPRKVINNLLSVKETGSSDPIWHIDFQIQWPGIWRMW